MTEYQSATLHISDLLQYYYKEVQEIAETTENTKLRC